jgi:hypothetical protein
MPEPTNFAKELQNQTSGCRLNLYKLGTRRTMSKGQIEQVAATFQADSDSVSGSRMVINRKHELVAPIYSLMFTATQLVKSSTIDYPERGLRLVKVSKIPKLVDKIEEIRQELEGYLKALDDGWAGVLAEAKDRLADLFNPADYPPKPSQAFGIEISFPAIKPDDRLLQMHPELYALEQKRIASRFDDALKLAEAAAADELGKLLKHFVDRLAPSGDGKQKMLMGSTLENIKDFTTRFKELSIGSNADLDLLVSQVETMANGIDIKEVRKSDPVSKQKLADQLKSFSEMVDELVVLRPVRELDLD